MRQMCYVLSVLCISVPGISSAAITTFTDLTAFNAAVAPLPVTAETFPNPPSSPGFYSIPGNVLSSSTLLAGLPAGTIQSGVTFSTPVNANNFYVIDSGGPFGAGNGWLHGIKLGTTTFALTITFDSPLSAFAFDTSRDMGQNFGIQIKFSSGPDFGSTLPGLPPSSTAIAFYGFQSSSADITQVILTGTHTGNSFALDNLRFTRGAAVTGTVPEPASIFTFGMAALAFGMGRLRQRMRRSCGSC